MDRSDVCLFMNEIIGQSFNSTFKRAIEFEFELNLLTTHHNNYSTYEQSYNAKNNTDTCIHNIRVMSIERYFLDIHLHTIKCTKDIYVNMNYLAIIFLSMLTGKRFLGDGLSLTLWCSER